METMTMNSDICPCCGQEKISVRAISLGLVQRDDHETLIGLEELHRVMERGNHKIELLLHALPDLEIPTCRDYFPEVKYKGRLPEKRGRRRAQNKRIWKR